MQTLFESEVKTVIFLNSKLEIKFAKKYNFQYK